MLLIWMGLMGCQPSKVTIPDNVIDLAKEEAKFRFYNGILLYHNKPFSGYLVVHFPSKKIFTKERRKDYTILIPQMAPVHFDLL